MRSFLSFTILALSLLQAVESIAFENLDFEQAFPDRSDEFEFIPGEFQFSTVADILPGWSVEGNEFAGTDYAYYNSLGHIGAFPVIFNIFDGFNEANFGEFLGIYPQNDVSLKPIQGNFSLYIDTVYGTGSLSQVGQVPTDAKSLRFIGKHSTWSQEAGGFEVSLGGIKLDLLELGTQTVLSPISGDTLALPDNFCTLFPNACHASSQPPIGFIRQEVSVFGANMPEELAGTAAELEFSLGMFNLLLIDDIQFSPFPVPEPSTLCLLTFICTLLVSRTSKQVCC